MGATVRVEGVQAATVPVEGVQAATAPVEGGQAATEGVQAAAVRDEDVHEQDTVLGAGVRDNDSEKIHYIPSFFSGRVDR